MAINVEKSINVESQKKEENGKENVKKILDLVYEKLLMIGNFTKIIGWIQWLRIGKGKAGYQQL